MPAMNSEAGVLTMATASHLWGSRAENGVQTEIHPGRTAVEPLICPFECVFPRKAHKGRHLARQMWITEAWALPPISPVGPGWGPESRAVSSWVFLSSENNRTSPAWEW